MSTCKFILHINECGILYINILCLISAITFLPSMLKAANISLKRKYLPINIEDEYFSSDSQCFAQYYASGKRKNKKNIKKEKPRGREEGRMKKHLPSLSPIPYFPSVGCQAVDVSYSNLSSIFISQFSPSHLPNQEELITDMEPGLRHHIIPQGCQHRSGRLSLRRRG